MLLRVGYLLAEKKAQMLGLLDVIKKRLKLIDIDIIAINDHLPLEQQGPFHMIIHKISDYQRDADNGDPIAIQIIKEMYQYEKKYSSTCVFIDSMKMVFQLANRATMNSICEQVTFTLDNYNVYVPAWIEIIDRKQIPDLLDVLPTKGVTYPILCKALNAAEGPGAHDMQLIFNEYQLLNELQVVPCIAQSFINHNMNMCKIFVVGTSWCIVNRPSIRNFKDSFNKSSNGYYTNQSSTNNKSTKTNDTTIKSIVFNSHQVSKPDSVSYLNKYAKLYHQHVSYGNNELLNDNVVNELIKRLQKVIPFTLMGIDIIVNGCNYGLIDINFLPGYDGMVNFYDEFFNLIIKQLNNISTNKISYSNGSLSNISSSINHISH